MTVEVLHKLTPELKAALNRHPAAIPHPSAAGPAAPAAPVDGPRSGRSGKTVIRWCCHQCGQGFSAWAAAERHRHPDPFGGLVGVIELVLT